MKKISQQQVQEHQENIGSTRVTIEPNYQGVIQSAVDFINQKDPSILRDVTDIYGHVDRGGLFGEYQTQSPHTIYVDIKNIENQVKNGMQGGSDEQIKNEIRNQLIKTLVHESKHMQEHSSSGQSSESGPEQAEKGFEQYLQPISCRDGKTKTAANPVRIEDERTKEQIEKDEKKLQKMIDEWDG